MSKTIVMIHGMCGGGWYWREYQQFFEAAGYQCLAPYLPYHEVDPAAEPHPALGEMSLLDYANALEALIRSLPDKPILMGHSMGGLLTQILAARGLADAVVLITPASPAGILALTPSVVKSFLPVLTRWNFWKKPFKLDYDTVEYAMLHRVPAPDRQGLYDQMVYESGHAAFEIGYWLFDSKNASKVNAEDVKCPMLVIGAAEDRITPASVVRQVARKYPQAQYREYEQHAHWIIGEPDWERVANDTLSWLNNLA
jgi:pimeloyl-ACP methyl ester carboxylesterase